MDVLLDGLHVFCILFLGIGVVEAEIAGPAEFVGGSEVHDERFCVAYVQIAVRLGRKPGVEPSAVLAGCQIAGNLLFHKVQSAFADCFLFNCNIHLRSCSVVIP